MIFTASIIKLRFLSCGCYFFPLLATEYIVSGVDAIKKTECEKETKKKNDSKIAKQFIGELSFLVDFRRPVDENGRTTFNSLNFLYPIATPIRTETETFT